MSSPWLRRLAMAAFTLLFASNDPGRAGGLDSDGDGVADGVDLCPDTAIPESVPELGLANHHFALFDADQTFDTLIPNEGLVSSDYTTATTAGCSCEQIIALIEKGYGHVKYGCSPSVMEEFVTTFASNLIFADGFQSGDSSAWSSTQPPV